MAEGSLLAHDPVNDAILADADADAEMQRGPDCGSSENEGDGDGEERGERERLPPSRRPRAARWG